MKLSYGELGGNLGFLIRMAQIKDYESFFESFAETALSPGQYAILEVLRCNQPVIQGQVAKALRIKPAHMTKVIRKLESLQWVTREVPESNRRTVMLRLTEQGATVLAAAQTRMHERSLDTLTVTEQGELKRLLKKVTGI